MAQQQEPQSRVVYEGSASGYPERQSDELRLEDAFKDAYEKGKAGKSPPYKFRVVGIFVEGTNPPSDYRVHLVDHP